MMWSYEKEEEHLRRLLRETDKEEEQQNAGEPPYNTEAVPDDESDAEIIDYIERQDENSDSEQDISDSEQEIYARGRNLTYKGKPCLNISFVNKLYYMDIIYLGKDGTTTWNMHAPKPRSIRRRQENIIKTLPGPSLSTRNMKHIVQIWKCLVNEEMITEIVRCTNLFIESIKPFFSRSRDANLTSEVEITALIGLLYMAGIYKANRLNTEDLWRTDGSGIEIFRLTMSLQRFRFLLRCVRFDDKDTREDREKTDKLAAIRDIFDRFVHNCETAYNMSEFVTIDEMLPSFRGNCNFRMYIPSKPNKYGIKIFALCDAKMFYTSKMEVYVGRQPDGPRYVSNSASDVVYRLCENMRNSGRNLTTDNWFTSIPLAKTLLQEYKLTIIGTIRKNKRELPLQFSKPVPRPAFSSMFGFNTDCTVVSYIPKPGKNVLVISTLHRLDEIDPNSEVKKKPVIISDYNATKGGVDTVDKLCANYNVARNTRRWPMVIFYTMLNIAGINSQIIYTANNPGTEQLRRNFLRELANGLIKPHLELRAQISCLPTTIKLRLSEICRVQQQEVPQQNARPGRCAFCDWKKNRKTRFCCFRCNTFMCLEHITAVCGNCLENVPPNNN